MPFLVYPDESGQLLVLSSNFLKFQEKSPEIKAQIILLCYYNLHISKKVFKVDFILTLDI